MFTSRVGNAVGVRDGAAVGWSDGSAVGPSVGARLGNSDGWFIDNFVEKGSLLVGQRSLAVGQLTIH